MTSFPVVPHHDGSPLYLSNEMPALGESIAVRLRVPAEYPSLARVHVRSRIDFEPAWAEAIDLGVDAQGWRWWEARMIVGNVRTGYRWFMERDDGRILWLNQAGLSTVETRDADDFMVTTVNAPPAWMDQSVMYQIFPDRFAKSARMEGREMPEWAIPAQWHEPLEPRFPGRAQQLYGGDLDGIVEHLDHLVHLGVTLIYLTPFFTAESNHRYDALTFDEVDPVLGGEQALIRLVQAAHSRGLKVIGDLTTNHSGAGHDWFTSAFGNPGSPEADYYYFDDDANTQYACWLGATTLPKFDWSSSGLRERFFHSSDSVVKRWLDAPYELDGWRIDVANMTGRHGIDDYNVEIRQELRRAMTDVNPHTLLLAESANEATEDFNGDAWHGAMTYADFTRPLWAWLTTYDHEPWIDAEGCTRTAPWYFGQPVSDYPSYSGGDVVASYERFSAGIPWRVRRGIMHGLDSHDTARFASHARPGAVMVAFGLAVTLPGIPMVWMGDEFGLTGRDGEDSRSPMPWSGEGADIGTLELYRSLILLRHDHSVLSTGGLRWLAATEDCLVFVREGADESVLVMAARAGSSIDIASGVVAAKNSERLRGEATLVRNAIGMTLCSDGPTLTVWNLPGIDYPSRPVADEVRVEHD